MTLIECIRQQVGDIDLETKVESTSSHVWQDKYIFEIVASDGARRPKIKVEISRHKDTIK